MSCVGKIKSSNAEVAENEKVPTALGAGAQSVRALRRTESEISITERSPMRVNLQEGTSRATRNSKLSERGLFNAESGITPSRSNALQAISRKNGSSGFSRLTDLSQPKSYSDQGKAIKELMNAFRETKEKLIRERELRQVYQDLSSSRGKEIESLREKNEKLKRERDYFESEKPDGEKKIMRRA